MKTLTFTLTEFQAETLLLVLMGLDEDDIDKNPYIKQAQFDEIHESISEQIESQLGTILK